MPIELPPVAKWLKMKTDDVLDCFHSIKGSFSYGTGLKRFVYIPGTRSDRVLMVAHADTVFGDNVGELGYHDDIIYSKSRLTSFDVPGRFNNSTISKVGVGIGADDRAGCAIVWALRNLGHSILITSGEESGCVAANYIMESDWWKAELNNTHQFAIEFDRRGHKDIVFYDIGTKKFAEYVKGITKYVPSFGSSTDIKHICKNICGVNISVGYHGEHTSGEQLVVSQWQNTLCIAKDWLSTEDLPKFELDKTDIFSIVTTNNYSSTYHGYPGYGGYDGYGDTCSEHDAYSGVMNGSNFRGGNLYTGNNGNTSIVPKDPVNTAVIAKPIAPIIMDIEDEPMQCPFCGANMVVRDWFQDKFKCITCQQEI